MSLRTFTLAAGAVLACTPSGPAPSIDAPAPAEVVDYGPAPPPSYLPRQTLRPGDRDVGRAPVSLTASDGAGLRLTSYKARAVVQEPLAFTELHLVFENPTDRTIEGRFEIDMPQGAAISRFAMQVHGAWQEGEVVERRAAQVAFEDALHRKQDPALLENRAGNSFSARVFPILPHERKQLIVAYSQDLPSSAEPYRLPLRGLPELDELDASVILHEPAAPPSGVTTSIATTRATRRVIELKKTRWTPDQDLEVLADRGLAMMGLRHDNLALARVVAVGTPTPAPIVGLTVLFDTSASRALGFADQVERMHETLRALQAVSGDYPLRLVVFDQTTHEVYRGKISGLRQRHLDEIVARGALGASDLEAALTRIGQTSTSTGERVLLYTDGISTAGDSELSALQQATSLLGVHGVVRLDAVIDGGIRDAAVLRQLSGVGRLAGGVVLDARLPAAVQVHKLTTSTLPTMKVTIPDAMWTWPDKLTGLQPGDEALVYADLPVTAAMRVILVGEDRLDATVPTVPVERPLLERAWVGARIDRLTTQRSALPVSDSDTRDAYRKQIVELSTRFRVLSDFTALLVLETEADYRRFDIDRRALRDILTVDANGVTLQNRRAAAPTGPHVANNDVIPMMARSFDPEMAARQAGILGVMQPGSFAAGDDAAAWGLAEATSEKSPDISGLGLVGTGRGGGGAGSGYGPGVDPRGRSSPPVIRMQRPEVHGGLERELVKRHVRSHLPELHACYRRTLQRDPHFGGRIDMQFTIDAAGRVPSAVIYQSPATDEALGECIAAAARRWRFPKSDDGAAVIVDHPFTLEPGSAPIAPVPGSFGEWASEQERRARGAGRSSMHTPLAGEMLVISRLIARKDHRAALARALAWRTRDPGDVLAVLALGEALEAAGKLPEAARAYGSIIDLFPARADLRRHAGNRLERLGAAGLPLALDTYARAVEQRPDHPASHRLYAFALSRAGRHADALAAILRGLAQTYPEGRFAGVDRVLRDDAGILAAVAIAADPASVDRVRAQLEPHRVRVANKPSLRFVLNWETDANDVDFHIVDARGHEASYAQRELPSGGELYADVTTGYGPECFAIEGTPTAFPYALSAHYYNRGPMGYGMGKLQVLQHDGAGELRFDDRPFVIMQDRTHLQLGAVAGPLQ